MLRLASFKPRKVALPVMAGLIVVAVATVAFAWYQQQKMPIAGPLSRQVMAYAEQLVIAHKSPPPTAALQYAYVASAYADALQQDGQAGALYAAKRILVMLYPDSATNIEATVGKLADTSHVTNYAADKSAPPAAQEVVSTYASRYATDGHDLVWDGVIPKGPGKWVDVTGIPPVTPRAGEWKRWVVNAPIQVPPPPVLGSAEDNKQLYIVTQAVAGRNGADVQTINFWAGSIGTETPAGLWQNQLFKTVNKNLSWHAAAADKTYATIQKNLAQTMSDSFMECWKVKYTYWTARPDQRLPGLKTGMPDPNFPSYISGHSTVSKAAADVLSVMVPQYRDTWESMAMQARNSRLVAGIHFDIDNSVGFTVGTDVANQAISNLHIKRVI